ncbi:retrieval of early ER protein Rer1 [Kipferlia bialata]|uniref:Retrieval of early ER protein Rer1 n=1 Tax=Kipferlia bialata TaxID=797122 RepID=A0A9K3CVA8_9EUKA|nr:retrieval of early ER protein Rer1 [Kipferlia bialata]|eukprot:g3366.t1
MGDVLPQTSPGGQEGPVSPPETLPEFMKAKSSTVFDQIDSVLNMTIPMKNERWIGLAVVAAIYLLRVIVTGRFYLITYCLYLYAAGKFVLFVTPRVTGDSMQDDMPSLPTSSGDEYKPFVRKLPEYKFWRTLAEGQAMAAVASLFPFFDIPVYAPILVIYLCLLGFVLVKQELSRWERLNVSKADAVKQWFGLIKKPNYTGKQTGAKEPGMPSPHAD